MVYMSRLLSQKSKLILFGSGSAARTFLNDFTMVDKVAYVVDNNEDKWGLLFEGFNIESPQKLLLENKKDILIVITSSFYKDIARQLEGMGFKRKMNFINVFPVESGGNKAYWNKTINFLHKIICGIHPYNTMFSFNYHNVSRIIKDIKESAHLFKGVLVDIGAGRSPYYNLFSVDQYIAVDLPGSLPQGEQRNITQMVGNVLELPLNDSSCDCAVSMQVLEHVPDTDKALKEIYRIMKENGTVLISVPHISPIHLEPHDYYRFTPIGMAHLLKKNGFSIVTVKQQGGLFASLALTFNMDIVISRYNEGQYTFRPIVSRMVYLSPLIGIVNILALFFDKVYKSYRSPTNIFIIARKDSIDSIQKGR